MKHRGEMIDATKWMLLAMLAMVVVSCSNIGESSTGAQQEDVRISEARELLSTPYPDASRLPVTVSDAYEGAVWNGSSAYINPAMLDSSSIEIACIIVHEWAHSTHTQTTPGTEQRTIDELQANEASAVCHEYFGSAQYVIEYYRGLDGKHSGGT